MDSMKNIEELVKHQLQACEELVAKEPENELILKAHASVKLAVSALSSLNEDAGADEGFKKALKHYTQSVLDSTYYTECQFVEEGFVKDQAKENILQTIFSLTKPTTLCSSPKQVTSLLDVQQLECLHWRVGALLYMYCHTLMGNEERKKEVDDEDFREYCCVGVCHLRLMLSTRTPLGVDEEYTALDPSVPQLLQRGIFSDIHMICLMYVGELCYWCWERGHHKQANIAASVSTCESRQDGVEERRENKDEPSDATNAQCDRLKGNVDELEVHALKLSENDDKDSSSVSPKTVNSVNDVTISNSTTEEQESDSVVIEKYHQSRLYSLLFNTKGVEFINTWMSDFDALKEGIESLTKYVEIARGPLKDHGWSYDRAVKLLVELKRASVK